MNLSISHKLVAAFLSLTVFVLVVTLGLARWSFEQGFLDYVNALEQVRLEQLATELGQQYKSNGKSWKFLTADGFARLSRPVPPDRGPGPPRHRPPRIEKGGGVHPPAGSRRDRFEPNPGGSARDLLPTAVFDVGGNQIAGSPVRLTDGTFISVAIVVDNELIGELRGEPRRQFTSSIETEFSRQQWTTSWVIAVSCLVVALGLSLILARGLLAPVRRLITSVAELAGGNYSHRENDDRADELGELMKNLNQLGSTLEANQSSRKRLLADVSHELRTPLTVLTGEIEALRDGLRNFDDTQLESIDQEVRRLRYLVDDLYELAVSDVGGLRYRFAETNLTECVEEAVKGLLQRALAKGIELYLSDSPGALSTRDSGPVFLVADRQRLDQLLLNLVENSIAYTDAPGRIVITVARTDADAVIVVEDTAPGVSKRDCEQLFEPLVRLEASRSRRTGGAGLGLAVCRNIVAAHGGTISASPGLLGGLLIEIAIPLTPEFSV